MKIMTISAITNFIQTTRIREFDAKLFHGLAQRGGQFYPHDTTVWANNPPGEQLAVTRTGRMLPTVFQPSTHLIVSGGLAKQLESLDRIRLQPVRFERLVDLPHSLNTPADTPLHDPRDIIRALPDVADLHSQAGPYFELLSVRNKDIEVMAPQRSRVYIDIITGTAPLSDIATLVVSAEILNTFPVMWIDGELVLNECVSAIIDPHLDREYFNVREYEVDVHLH